MNVTAIRLADGTDVAGADATCEGCGSPMADHSCGGTGAAAGTGSVTYSRSTGPRKPPTSHPTCPHCGGRIHFNMGGTAINAECLTRQYAIDQKLISNPNERLPVLTLDMMESIVDWAKTLSTPLTYGKMESSAGGAGTYSGLRVKTGRKKKAVAAAPGAQIQDMADEEGAVAIDPVAKPKKGRKARKAKAMEAPTTPVITDDTVMDDDELTPDEAPDVIEQAEEIAAAADSGDPELVDNGASSESFEDTIMEAQIAAEPATVDADAAREARAERRRQRKALLAGKS